MGRRSSAPAIEKGPGAAYWIPGIALITTVAFATPAAYKLAVACLASLPLIGIYVLHNVKHPAATLARVVLILVGLGTLGWSLALHDSLSVQPIPHEAATSNSTVATGGQGATEPTPVATPTSAPEATPSLSAVPVAHTWCPTPGHSASPELVVIRVVYWCFGDVISDSGELVETQKQVKVRLGLTNESDVPMSVSTANPSRIRLIVAGDDVGQRWSPRAGTLSLGDRPAPVTINGQSFWAIPPNVNFDEKPVSSVGLYTGFSSKWDQPAELGPGLTIGGGTEIGDGSQTYNGPDASADLVFQVPVDSYSAPLEILGVAVFGIPEDTSVSADWSLVGLCHFDDWGPQLSSVYF